MPHMCTRCKSIFDEGVDVLEGCPVCGWKKFLFVRSKKQVERAKEKPKISEIGGPYEPWPENDDSLDMILKATTSRGREGRRKLDEAIRESGRESGVRAKKRPSSGAESSYPSSHTSSPPDPASKEEHHEDGGGEMVESIRMSGPGTYELNLASLFEREELVMAVKDGTYLIDLSSIFKKWRKD